jgi:RNA polymerase sigma-70 factor (ECF subfamily)
VQALPRPVVGADKVARLLALAVDRLAEGSLEVTDINGSPALILRFTDQVDTVTVLHVENGKIAGFYAVRNPAKLAHLTEPKTLTR